MVPRVQTQAHSHHDRVGAGTNAQRGQPSRPSRPRGRGPRARIPRLRQRPFDPGRRPRDSDWGLDFWKWQRSATPGWMQSHWTPTGQQPANRSEHWPIQGRPAGQQPPRAQVAGCPTRRAGQPIRDPYAAARAAARSWSVRPRTPWPLRWCYLRWPALPSIRTSDRVSPGEPTPDPRQRFPGQWANAARRLQAAGASNPQTPWDWRDKSPACVARHWAFPRERWRDLPSPARSSHWQSPRATHPDGPDRVLANSEPALAQGPDTHPESA